MILINTIADVAGCPAADVAALADSMRVGGGPDRAAGVLLLAAAVGDVEYAQGS